MNVTRKRIAAVLAVLAVAAVTLTAWTGLASAKQTGTLTGAGSTFVVPLVTQWTQSYHASQVSYSGIGSGGGIAAITARTVDFGASDAPLTPDQASACKGCVQIPWAFSATSIPYHVVRRRLRPEADRARSWPHLPRHDQLLGQPDDQVDQSGGQAPAREDRARSTAVMAAARATTSPTTSPTSVRRGRTRLERARSPTSRPASAHAAVPGSPAKLTTTPGGITYVDVAYSLKNKFTIAKIKNRAGKFQLPGLVQIRAAADSIKKLQEQPERVHGRRPEPPTAEGLSDLHLHVGDHPAEDEQGARAEEVRRLGSDQGPELRAKAALRPAT